MQTEETVKTISLLAAFEMKELASSHLDELSDEEKQHVAAAQAVVNQPKTDLTDERATSLDPKNAQPQLDLFSGLNRGLGTTVIVATTGPCEALPIMADYRIRQGRLVKEATKES